MAEPVPRHRDLLRISPLENNARFIRRLALDDPLLVKPDGSPTQLAQGWTDFMGVSQPHTMDECPWAWLPDKEPG